MSNGTFAPYGLSPYQYLGGAPWDGKVRMYPILSGLSVNIFSGDPVVMGGGAAFGPAAGTVVPIQSGSSATVFPVGVFVGCKYILPGGQVSNQPGSYSYWPANTVVAAGTQAMAMVVDDPFVIFKAQCDAGFGSSAVGLNSTLDLGAPGNLNNGSSGVSVGSTVGTNATYPVRIVGAPMNTLQGGSTFYDGTPATYFNDLLVMFNNHVYKQGGAATRGA